MGRLGSFAAVMSVVAFVGCGTSALPVGPSGVPDDVSASSQLPGESHASTAAISGTDTSIVVDRGQFDFAGTAGEIALDGTRGFSLRARVTAGSGVVEATQACPGSTCAPGTIIPLGAAWAGHDLAATVTLDGHTYSNVGSVSADTAALVRFDGTLVTPPLGNRASQTLTAPFTVVGEFVHANPAGELVTEAFTGRGQVKVRLVAGDGGWFVERMTYRLKH